MRDVWTLLTIFPSLSVTCGSEPLGPQNYLLGCGSVKLWYDTLGISFLGESVWDDCEAIFFKARGNFPGLAS